MSSPFYAKGDPGSPVDNVVLDRTAGTLQFYVQGHAIGSPVDVTTFLETLVWVGTNAATPRPSVAGVVQFAGFVQPAAAQDGDFFDDCSGDPPTISTTTLGSLNVGMATDQFLVASGSTPITWSVTAGTLPAGLSFGSAGELYGSPTATGAYDFTVAATNGYVPTGTPAPTQRYTGSVGAAVTPVITTGATSLPTMTAGTLYTASIGFTGSVPIVWSVVTISGQALPAGLTLNPSSGVITGTPSTDGAYSFTVQASNSAIGGGTTTQNFTGTVMGSPPVFVTTSLGSLSQGAAITPITLNVTGSSPITYALASGSSLPAGLSASTSTGSYVISGTPTGTGTYSFTLNATNSYTGGTPVSQTFSGTIAPGAPTITTTSLGSVYRAVPVSLTLGRTGATPITWSVSTGSLPSWLSFNTTTGVLSGTPTTTGSTWSFSITAHNSYSPDAVQAFSGTVLESSPAITETTLNSMASGTAFTPQQLHATGYPTITYALAPSSAAMPGTLAISSSGLITGTPTGTSYSFTVRATNSIGYSDTTFSGSINNYVPPPFDSVGLGSSTNYVFGGTSITWNHTVVATANVYAFVVLEQPLSVASSITPSSLSLSMKCGGVPMSLIGYANVYDGYQASGVTSFAAVYELTGVSAGTQTMLLTPSGNVGKMTGNSIAYTGVGSRGSLLSTGGSTGTAMSHSITGATTARIVQAFTGACMDTMTSYEIGGTSATPHYNLSTNLYDTSLLIGDAAGTGSALSFTASQTSGTNWYPGWESIAIVIDSVP